MRNKIVAIIDCDISDRESRKCEVDEKTIGSCGQRADYCMWALWTNREITDYGKEYLKNISKNPITSKHFAEMCGTCGNVFNSYITETCPLCRLRELIRIRRTQEQNSGVIPDERPKTNRKNT